jgi:hypothetical protein
LERIQINSRLSLCKPRPASDLAVRPGKGWWDAEPGLRWSGRNGRSADLEIENSSPSEMAIRIKAIYASLRPNNFITLTVNGSVVPTKAMETGFLSETITLRIGSNAVRFVAALEPEPPTERDARTLGIMWKGILIERADIPRGS